MKKTVQLLIVFMLSMRIDAVNQNLIVSDTFPQKLSEFHFFVDGSAQIPHGDVIPYELISTLFSDYSYKQRWVYAVSYTHLRAHETPEHLGCPGGG